jgi:outer membrane protein assembly factor BamB
MLRPPRTTIIGLVASLLLWGQASGGEDWPQWKYDCRHSGDVPDRSVATPLGLIGAVPLTDAVLTSPVVSGGRIYAVDASGVAFCIDKSTLQVVWKVSTRGGKANCNNVSSPALAGRYLHFGTMAGVYYVLDAATGKVVREIGCGEPIFSAPVVANDRVYFATLGSQVYAIEPDGTVCWMWDLVKDDIKFAGNRWSGADWLAFKKGRVNYRDQFCCSADIAVCGKTVVLPAAGRTLWLEDAGNRAELRAVGEIPECAGSEYAPIFGLSIGPSGAAYVQWHRRDNTGRTDILRLEDGKISSEAVPGTRTAINLHGLLSFCSVSIRGEDVYRCRPEAGLGFCKHSPGRREPQSLGGFPSICTPILLGDVGIYGGLDGCLYVVPLSGSGKLWSFKTAFGKAISAPAAVCDGRIYFGCEDGYLYVLGSGGKATLPSDDLQLSKVRSPLSSKLADSRYDWFTNYGNLANTNANDEGVRPPLVVKWIRRYEGTFKHLPVCGGGRMYLHTSEGQIMAVEQETGRLLWRRYFPDVYLSFTSPLYHNERLLVPQAGMRKSLLRCLDAATGELLWESPFSGSPSWSRQQPPVVYKNLAIYMFGSGKYAAQGTAKPFVFSGEPEPSPDGAEIMSWIYTHDNPFYPQDNKPLVRAWDLQTGREVWSKDFSEFGSGGNDSGLCLMDGTLYYSTFFGYAAKWKGQPGPTGLTAALEPETGKLLWSTTKHSVTGGCTISGRDGRLYLGGYNQPNDQTKNRYVCCLDARDGSLVWQSEPVAAAINVVTVGEKYALAFASWKDCCLLDKNTGKIVSRVNLGYACTRFTLSEPYLLFSNMDMIDLSRGNELVYSGPAVDSRECVGSVVSNGRVFYTAQASGLQLSLVYGDEAVNCAGPWVQPTVP